MTSHSDCQVAERPREPKPCSNLNVFLSFREREIKTAMVIEVAQRVKALVGKADNLSSIPGTPIHGGKRELTPTNCLLISLSPKQDK